jgi:hypothetical protein
MRRLTVIAAAAAALLATVLAGGAPAAAGVVTIHPDQFVAEPSATVTLQNPGSLGGNGSFFRVVRLPVGRRVVKLLVTYSSGGAYAFRASLLRKRVGELNDVVIDHYESTATPGGPVTVESLPGELDGPAGIAPGNRWFVSLRLDSTNGAIHDVRVVWR